MARLVVLLRGINIGSRNRISMPELRKALEDAGYDDVRTYLQSGNVVLTSTASPKKVARECERLIADRFASRSVSSRERAASSPRWSTEIRSSVWRRTRSATR